MGAEVWSQTDSMQGRNGEERGQGASVGLLMRVRAECGEVGEFRMVERSVVLLSGETAQEVFFRARDEQLDPQPTAVRMTKPIFGDGVVYDLPPERRRETLRTPALRDENLRKSAGRIGTETEAMLDGLGAEGAIVRAGVWRS